MKKYLLRSSFLMILVGSMLVGCHSDVDLKNIDTSSEIELGMALPVGSIRATVRDFLGDVKHLYIDSLDNQGVLVWRDTFDIDRRYHKQDIMPKRISAKSTSFAGVYDQMESKGIIGQGGQGTGDGQPRTLDFEVVLQLDNINSDPSNRRLDSVLMSTAQFVSRISFQNLPIQEAWIDEIKLDLGKQVLSHKANNELVVYKKGEGSAFDTDLMKDLNNFTFCLMNSLNMKREQPKSEWDANRLTECKFTAHIKFTIPNGQSITVPQNAKITYKLGLENMDFIAAWGFFKPSNLMEETTVEQLTRSWKDLEFLRTATTPFAKPHIVVDVRTEVAGALVLHGNYLYSSRTGYTPDQRLYATFGNGSADDPRSVKIELDKSRYLDPYTSPIGQLSDKIRILFDEDPQRGHLDNMFKYMPDSIGYSFNVDINTDTTPQARLTKNDNITGYAYCELPMIFNKGLFIQYTDDVDDISLSQFSIDSLLKEVAVIDTLKTSDIKLILKAENGMQFSLKAAMRCFNEKNEMIMEPSDASKPFILFEQDTIHLAAANFTRNGGVWSATSPGETTLIANMTKERLNVFPQVKRIEYTVIADDESLQEAFEKGLLNIRVNADDMLKLKIGLTAHLDAVLKFNNNEEK